MKRILFYLFICLIHITNCSAQSTNLTNVFKQVNQTLRTYVIGTREFMPYYIKSEGDRWEYKKTYISFDYPNLIFEYIIGAKVKYPGYHSDIKEGTFKVTIPISSIIEYPGSYSLVGQKHYNNTTINIINEEGLTKYTNGKASILTSFSLYGDEELTAKKLASELKELQRLILNENFQGKLGSVQQKRPSSPQKKAVSKSTSSQKPKSSNNTTGTTKKYGKYGQ